jgi:hypothetical protein
LASDPLSEATSPLTVYEIFIQGTLKGLIAADNEEQAQQLALEQIKTRGVLNPTIVSITTVETDERKLLN